MRSLSINFGRFVPQTTHEITKRVSRLAGLITQRMPMSTRPVIATRIAPTVALKQVIASEFALHPFTNAISKQNAEKVMRHYYGMSQAFPYLQAGAYKDIILNLIRKNQSASESIEETFVVGAFLSFDETGGNWLLRTEGIAALPKLLRTDKNFHASLLREDIKRLFGRELAPDYRDPTATYLTTLLKDLGSLDTLKRTAAMVAFEMHAGQMIESLWNALLRAYPTIDKETLSYFRIHVGGDDPQEEYHKQLTNDMTTSLVPSKEVDTFINHFRDCYSLNYNWCRDITYVP